MSYVNTNFPGLFAIARHTLQAGHHRFGGTHGQLAYKVSDGSPVDVVLHHNDVDANVNIIDATEETVTLILRGYSNVAAVFANLAFVDVSGFHTLASDTHAVLVQGSLTLDGNLLDSTERSHLLLPGSEVSGTGKLVTFVFSQP